MEVQDAAFCAVPWQSVNALEHELDRLLVKLRHVKVLRLQKEKEELEHSRKCKVCTDSDVEVVLVPCGTR